MILPVLYFAENNPSWEIKALGSLSTSFSGGTPSSSVQEYYNGNIPFIRSGEINNNSTELYITPKGLDNSSARVVNKGTILYALYGATSGEVALSHIQGAINQAILAIFPNERIIDKHYLVQYLKANKEAIISTYLQGGQGNLSGAIIKSIAIQYPKSLTTQKKIAYLLDDIDKQINLEFINLEKKKQIKSASLQSMFPQEGESVPKVRFKGFTKKWNTISFSQSFEFLKNNTLSRAELSETGKVYNIHYGDILIKFGDCLFIEQNCDIPFIKDEKVANKLINSSLIKNGDIIFADAAEDYTVGKCIEIITKKENKIVSGLHTIACRPTQHFASGYLGYFLNSNLFHNQLIGIIQGSKVCGISKKGLQTTHLIYPEDLGEQQKIAAYFENLDRQISLETQRLEKLKQIKSACLDKMFV